MTTFFFISGYLISTLMLREWQSTGRFSLRAFWMRRVLRLAPPLALALASSVAIVHLVPAVMQLVTDTPTNNEAAKIDLPTLLSQIFFYFNYYFVAGHASPIPGTDVLWSLSVEEHFYLLWPLVFPIFAPLLVARSPVWALWMAAALVGFALWRVFRLQVWGDSPVAVYFMSDTRLDSLLFGCTLSFVHYVGWLPKAHRPLLWLIAGAALYLLRLPEGLSAFRYSFQGIALLFIFHAAITQPDHWAIRPLNWAPVARIGVWSYGFYLIHYVILIALAPVMRPEPHGIVSLISWALASGALALTWAALVHRHVERPMAALRQRLYPFAP